MSSKEKNSSDKHPDCGKFAIAENGRLGLILEAVDLRGRIVFLGVPMDCDGNWASLKPRIVSGKVSPRSLYDAARHSMPEEDQPSPQDVDIRFVKLGRPDSKSAPGGVKDLLSALFGGMPPQQPPEVKLNPEDFTLDGEDPEDDGA
jgi:hypothetical protein